MSKRSADLLVEDIWEAVGKVERYTAGMTKRAFKKDEKTIDAVVRNLGIIGEAASRLADDFKEEHREIEWGQIVGLRHRIVHEYFGVDLEIVWQILHSDLLVLKEILRTIRKELADK